MGEVDSLLTIALASNDWHGWAFVGAWVLFMAAVATALWKAGQ
jgi:hypothetical protein